MVRDLVRVRRVCSMSSALLAGALSIAACGSEEESTGNVELDDSLRIWHGIRDGADGDYAYARIGHEATDQPFLMTLTIEHNVVVARSHQAISDSGAYEWTEDAANLGDNGYAAEIRTLDDLYLQCTGYVDRDPAAYELELDFFTNGVLRSCISNLVDQYNPEGFEIETFTTAP
jgi:hypothetical protein